MPGSNTKSFFPLLTHPAKGHTITRRLLLFLAVSCSLWAANPPDPSGTSMVGDLVTNPVSGLTTTVTQLIQDPAGTPTAGTTAFVRTSDGYAFLVKNVNDTIYNGDTPPQGFQIQSKDTIAHTVSLVPNPPDPDPSKNTPLTLSYQSPFTDPGLQSLLSPGTRSPGTPAIPPVVAGGAAGIRVVGVGAGGDNGRDGALFVPPSSGDSGANGPPVIFTNSIAIGPTNQIGIEAGSIGGNGGNGGDSYASFWSGRDGGNGGAGGTVNVTNGPGVQIATTGDNNVGIFAYSRSGQAGDGGSGFVAPGGGTGGHSSDGGSVTVDNKGNISTTGNGASGIYGLSVSNNGGNGGSQWGLVGQSGSGGYGGNGGPVTIINESNATIQTSGDYADGIVGQSIGGTGGSSGTSGNLLLSLQGSPDNGGNGGAVSVTNNGLIATTGNYSVGIFAESVGGGGGTGGSSYGLLAVGGAGSNGGSSGAVAVTNASSASITTTGIQSDGILAQSVGGSGGGGSNAGGLIAIGGSGDKAGNGGAVTVSNFGSISTQGNGALGIFAQSVGGGGGDGGNSGGLVSVGGSGNGGGSSANVSVTNGGNITTAGNDARSIMVQSVGGGGGNGGSAGSVGLFVGVAVGGSAGGGNNAGDVGLTLQGIDATTASVIKTTGDRSTGVFAQSVGGGGGTGGGAVQVTGGIGGGAVSISVGGSGGSGGTGGAVTLSKGPGVSVIETGGSDATGLYLQSVGGGGGAGGYAISAAASLASTAGSLSIGVGGSGAVGGPGGNVSVGSLSNVGPLIAPGFVNFSNLGFDGTISTAGDRSPGLVAQSIGGGGGKGGLALAGSATIGLYESGSLSIAVGGSGGGGGQGGSVSVGTQANILTKGASSTGLLVQSVGGGGGDGGGAIAAGIDLALGASGNITVGVGGSGGTASSGGTVTAATRLGIVGTQGDNAAGIIVQSVGGGGGNGGYSVSAGLSAALLGAGSVNVGLGGKGGAGGVGGTVNADLQSNVTTSNVLLPQTTDPATQAVIPAHFGENSPGIVVQSVGGGGGNGGYNVTASGTAALLGSGAIEVGLGGGGSSGGTGGAVNASSTGTISTGGDRSSGFVAQSIGGGGGDGGYNVSAALSTAGLGAGAVAVGLGGKGGSGNNGGNVTAALSGNGVTTSGNESRGIVAQSVGGGGGNGGFNVSGLLSGAGIASGGVSVGLGGNGGTGGSGANVTLTNSSGVITSGSDATAVTAQSIGGGGGSGGFDVSFGFSGAGTASGVVTVGLGGKGGNGAVAGNVNSSSSGMIVTNGDRSTGFLSQSLGGGGGDGGFNVTAGGSGAGSGSGALATALGGNGGSGNNSGSVTSLSSGNIFTNGNQSVGILAQSVGGGGGNGGFNVAASGSSAGTGSGATGIGLGGSGGSAGSAGIVNLSVNNTVLTQGAQSAAVIGQSIGGGGGNGGFNISAVGSGAGTASGAITVGIGGSGGSAGNASSVIVATSKAIETKGMQSTGVIAQSVGGGGGNGSFNIVAGGSGAGSVSGAVGIGVGGSGGSAGNAGTVNLTVRNTVLTEGDQSSAVVGQSIGGGGGNGGFNLTAVGAGAGATAGAIGVGVGGGGGGGGNASAVTVSTTNAIQTIGASSSGGILAQSIGGGGGSGGFDLNLAGSGGGSYSGTVSAAVGGSGSGGGNASTVTLNSQNTVSTVGDNSSAIAAESIGGGGGNGGFALSGVFSLGAVLNTGVGGKGSGGGSADNVNVVSYGGAPLVTPAATDLTISTQGNQSNGIVAQSIGGGGGNGGFTVGAGFSLQSGAFGVTVGGNGGAGGYAGAADVTSFNNVVTVGDKSNAILAQSIGGGGGNGGFAITATAGQYMAGSVSVGGSGAAAGDAGNVTVDNFGNLQTMGDSANGIEAQSVGGGGGNGGFSLAGAFTLGQAGVSASVGGSSASGGIGRDVIVNSNVGVTLSTNSTIETAGQNADGIEAQSIGGGGGNGGFSGAFTATMGAKASLTLGVGGHGAAGNSAGSVTVTSIDNIVTSGAGSNGIGAQSIGGGGGSGGFSFAGTLSVPTGSSFSGSVSLGGSGGSAADANTVNVNSTGIISTTGNQANGVLAQSLGGGGGNGGLSLAGTFNFASGNDVPSLVASIGGTGGAGGAGNAVIVTRSGTTQTIGDSSNGIQAQSVGGGGGNGGLSTAGSIGGTDAKQIAVSVGGSGGLGSEAGDVTVTNTGAITTGSVATQQLRIAVVGEPVFLPVQVSTGRASNGILAQSLGGGGGNGGFTFSGTISPLGENTNVNMGETVGGLGGSGGFAGDVRVINNGLITTYGDNANGISAQSLGGGGGNGGSAITGLIAGGNVQSGANAVNFAESVGGTGGNGNVAGAVNVEQMGGIITSGKASDGILAQSIGGGGGTGGGANSLSLQLATSCTFTTITIPFVSKFLNCKDPKTPSLNIQVDVGGSGGAGNNGNTVTVLNHGFITTTGSASAGVYAESIGGGGGKGGQAIVGLAESFPDAKYIDYGLLLATVPLDAGNTATGSGRFTIGGSGGASGNGGTVSVTNQGVIQTSGDNSYGIYAHSVGGGGGSGGDASSGVKGALSIGGSGAGHGDGGNVTVTNQALANITTAGVMSNAIYAESVGGGGGSGGSAGGAIAVGGSAGASGNGGSVVVNNNGALQTSGDLAMGIYADSTGGGGGAGGALTLSIVSVGGSGGASGNGGEVDVNNSNTILTLGSQADAIHAQSTGGGGGSGGSSGGGVTSITPGLAVSVGGRGGSSGDGGTVNVTNSQILNTKGDNANGIYAQSVGGGGGDGGSAVGVVTVGGRGGATGNGGAVNVTNQAGGSIWTTGISSNGIYAQSVGGGGGTGGGAYATALVGVSTNVGGNGSGGGNGGTVTVNNFGQIETDGASSQAIFAQSVGGGGGNGAIASSFAVSLLSDNVGVGGVGGMGGNGGSVTVNNNSTGVISTNGDNSTAIFAQSVGGGGGNGGYASSVSVSPASVAVVVGGNGGSGGNGGAVTVNNNGAININAKNSVGILAQSVGGGGGTASSGLGVAVVPVQIGGKNGVVGKGGDVAVINNGSINIAGDNSIGIFAQSVGGGGGLVKPGGGATNVVLNSGGSGNGGAVTVTNTAGTVTITGNNSVALYSQSVGGGGGAVGVNADPPGQIGAFLFSGAAGGSGVAKDTVLNQTGNLVADGVNSVALVAQSNAAGGDGNITANIFNAAPGQLSYVVGGSAQGAGVFMLNGVNNNLNNNGVVSTTLGIEGYAVRATTGNDIVNNFGTVIGSVDLGAGANAFDNKPNATFLSGRTVDLGAGNLLTNEGVLSPGDWQRVLATNLNGNLLQTASGTYNVDLDLKAVAADRVSATGTAAVSGVVSVNLIDPLHTAAASKPGTHDDVIVSADAGETHPGIVLQATHTAVLTQSLVYPNNTDIVLQHVVDYAPLSLGTKNRISMGTAINAIQTAQQSPAFAPLATNLFFQPTVSALGSAYDLLSGSATSGSQQVSFLANDLFLSAIARQSLFWAENEDSNPNSTILHKNTIQQNGHISLLNGSEPSQQTGYQPPSAPHGLPSRTWRVWFTSLANDATTPGDTTIGSVSAASHGADALVAGLDYQINPKTIIGIAGGGGFYNFSARDLQTDGTVSGGNVGVYGAKRSDNYYLMGALAFSRFGNQSIRSAAVPGSVLSLPTGGVPISGFAETLNGHFGSNLFGGDLEAGYRKRLGWLEVTPYAGLQFGILHNQHYSETSITGGPSQLGLAYAPRTITSLPTFLGLELKKRNEFRNGVRFSSTIRTAWKAEWNRDRSTESSFETAPGFNFVVQGAMPQRHALRTSIVEMLMLEGNVGIFASFDGDFASDSHAYVTSFGAKVNW